MADNGGLSDIGAVIDASSLAEAVWTAAGTRTPYVRGVVALRRGERPVLAFTYADDTLAREMADTGRVTLTFTEPRSTSEAFRPVAVVGRPRLVEDADGDLFVAELLDQELRRFPPARVYADSPLLRREHWWFLPRLLVEVDVETVERIPGRTHAADQLLVVAAGDGTASVRVARPATDSGAPAEDLASAVGTLDTGSARLLTDTPVAAGAALLFGQDASFPDLERWSQWRWRGTWDGERFRVEEASARPGLSPAPGLLERWRRQRDLEKRCRRALAAR